MSFNRISAAEAASLIKHGYNIGLSGFTPAGTAKAVTAELAKIAEAEHAKGNPFQVGIFTGASTGESCDGVLARAKAIRYRAPYTTNSDFRKAVNNGEIAYNDIHLSQMAQEVRYGFMGKVNVAIIEACELTLDGKIYLTAAGGISPTICRLADQIIVELNSAHSKFLNNFSVHFECGNRFVTSQRTEYGVGDVSYARLQRQEGRRDDTAFHVCGKEVGNILSDFVGQRVGSGERARFVRPVSLYHAYDFLRIHLDVRQSDAVALSGRYLQ